MAPSVSGRTNTPRSARCCVLPALLVCAWAGLMAGCGSISLGAKRTWDVPQGEPFKPGNYTDAGPLPAAIKRVAVLPLHTDDWRPGDIAAIESAFSSELSKTTRFESVPVARRDMKVRFGRESLVSSAALPPDLLSRLRADFAVDAVLFLELTHFSPYQPLALGLRAKLVAVEDGSVLWSFDSLFDSAQPGVAVAARRFQMEQARPAPPLDSTVGVMQSPARFARYVAHDTFATLPGRVAQAR